jgi:hypothetical protein
METIVPILRQFGTSIDKLNFNQTQQLLEIGEKMKSINSIDIEETRKIMDILGISTIKKEQKVKPKRKCKPNELCPCNSGKKFKKCCGIVK